MNVQVRLFAAYREAVGTNRVDVALPAGARVSELLDRLTAEHPKLSPSSGMVAVNQEYVGPDYALRDGDEVALIPPVSGGA